MFFPELEKERPQIKIRIVKMMITPISIEPTIFNLNYVKNIH
jgi:hypothetical protein